MVAQTEDAQVWMMAKRKGTTQREVTLVTTTSQETVQTDPVRNGLGRHEFAALSIGEILTKGWQTPSPQKLKAFQMKFKFTAKKGMGLSLYLVLVLKAQQPGVRRERGSAEPIQCSWDRH